MLLAHALWERTPAGETANEDTWAAAEDVVARNVHDELRAIWTSLKSSQASGASSRPSPRTCSVSTPPIVHGGSSGGAVRSAAKALEDRGEIVRDEQAATGYRRHPSAPGTLGASRTTGSLTWHHRPTRPSAGQPLRLYLTGASRPAFADDRRRRPHRALGVAPRSGKSFIAGAGFEQTSATLAYRFSESRSLA